jgi:hypothetical protein
MVLFLCGRGYAAPAGDDCLGVRQDKLADVLKERSQEDYLLGLRIPVEQLKLQRFLRLEKDRSGLSVRFEAQASHPLFSQEGVSLYIVNLWGSACKPCKEELPLLLKTWRALAADPAVHVKLLLIHEEPLVLPEVLSEFIRAEPEIGARVGLFADATAGLREVLDQKPTGAPSLPTTLLVDRGGVIRQAYVGTLFNRDAALLHAARSLAGKSVPSAAPSALPGVELAVAQLADNVNRVSAIVRALDEKQKTSETLSAEDKQALLEFWQRVGIERPRDFQVGEKTRATLQKLLSPSAGKHSSRSDGNG